MQEHVWETTAEEKRALEKKQKQEVKGNFKAKDTGFFKTRKEIGKKFTWEGKSTWEFSQ